MTANNSKGLINRLALVATLILMFPNDSKAYLDLGTGSYVLQILLAVVFTWVLVVKRLWTRIISFLKTRFFKAK
ncbi:MAG: hypothetical protein ACLQPD_24205 [Desulfomonilaceae bacterium]